MKFGTRFRQALLILAAWAGVTLFFAAIRFVYPFGARPLSHFLYTRALLYAFWALALPAIIICARRFPVNQKFGLFAVLFHLALAVGLSVLIALGHIAILFFFGADDLPPLDRLIHSNLLVAFILILVVQAWGVWGKFQAEKMKSGELQRELALARLEALRMQLHPHFLFNTLHTIASLVVEQPDTACSMLAALGDFLRLTLNEGTASVRSLSQELEFCELYMGIEKLRLGDRLMLDYYIESDATRAEVPYLFLQPLFENAVRHGASRKAGPCHIAFVAQRRGERVHLRLENDGPLFPIAEERRSGVGLRNTRERLRLHYSDDFSFQFRSRPEGGARIDISFPYREQGDSGVLHAAAGNSYSHAGD